MVVWQPDYSSSPVIRVSNSILRLVIASCNLAIPIVGASDEPATNFFFFLYPSDRVSEDLSIGFYGFVLIRSIGIEIS